MRSLWASVLAASCAVATARELDHSTYIARDSDFAALQDGIQAAQNLRTRLFPNGIDETDITLYDARYIYIYSRNKDLPFGRRRVWKGYTVYQASHNAKVSEREMARCGATPDFVFAALGSTISPPFFSCSPWTIQAALQRKRRSIYDTRDAYLGTIIHEFAHAYHHLEDGRISVVAKIESKVQAMQSRHPPRRIAQEAYAIWCELSASQALFPAHFRRLSKNFYRSGLDDPHNLGAKIAVEILNEDSGPPRGS